MASAAKAILLARSVFYSGISWAGVLPGRRFARYGRSLGLRQLRGRRGITDLLLNPVSAVRYFEFDFADRQLPNERGMKILDVSSPSLLGYYLSENRNCDYLYTNLDEREFAVIADQVPFARVNGDYRTERQDATGLQYGDESFDAVISISVVEHIPGDGDSKAMAEMWRVLKPGGVLLVTVPVNAVAEDEFRSQDTYQVGLTGQDGKFFFQRWYDEESLAGRLLDPLPGKTETCREYYGERVPGFFREYEKRWIEKGLKETVRDPCLMARHMKRFNRISDLPGRGVVGFSLRKGAANA